MPELNLPSAPPPPSWVKGEEESSRGQDLLGLRYPVQEIGVMLLDGITTISPKIRYISHRTWLAWRYANLVGERPSFRNFSRAPEAAFVFGNLLVDPTMQDLIGPRKARILIEQAGNGDLPLGEELIKTPAVSIYTGPSENLGLTFMVAGDIPGVTKERGLPLAMAAEEAFGATDLGASLSQNASPARVSQAALRVYADAFSTEVPEKEREVLLEAVFPEDPTERELRRMATYSALLLDAGGGKATEAEETLFLRARQLPGEFPPEIQSILDGWLLYHVRDSLCVTHERALGALFSQMDSMAPRETHLTPETVVLGLLSKKDEISQPLLDLELLVLGEDPLGLRFSELERRISDRTSSDQRTERGLKRWDGGLTEWSVIKSALDSQVGALACVPVSWILAGQRAGIGLEEDAPGFEVMDFGRHERLGLKSVVIPLLRRLREEDPTLDQVLAEAVHLIADHHVRIALTRFSQDPTKDVSVLVRDGDTWALPVGREYEGGRPESRIKEAIGWLRQLGLVDEGGITGRGQRQLDEVLERLRKAGV